ncbi:hypothetical protein JTB14_016069 [Gonioctena quinquepunctata]|nr:hypothetical protein JTB14_016069 [Gonioctena quinquepunctata]
MFHGGQKTSIVKKKVRLARRRYQRIRRVENQVIQTIHSRNMYLAAFRAYKANIKSAEQSSWESYLGYTLAVNPWGTVYKMSASTLKLNHMDISLRMMEPPLAITKTL